MEEDQQNPWFNPPRVRLDLWLETPDPDLLTQIEQRLPNENPVIREMLCGAFSGKLSLLTLELLTEDEFNQALTRCIEGIEQAATTYRKLDVIYISILCLSHSTQDKVTQRLFPDFARYPKTPSVSTDLDIVTPGQCEDLNS